MAPSLLNQILHPTSEPEKSNSGCVSASQPHDVLTDVFVEPFDWHTCLIYVFENFALVTILSNLLRSTPIIGTYFDTTVLIFITFLIIVLNFFYDPVIGFTIIYFW